MSSTRRVVVVCVASTNANLTVRWLDLAAAICVELIQYRFGCCHGPMRHSGPEIVVVFGDCVTFLAFHIGLNIEPNGSCRCTRVAPLARISYNVGLMHADWAECPDGTR
jgi:hypothetical protein